MDIKILASGSGGNAYFLGAVSSLLLECGLPFQELQKALDFQLSSVAGCLVSHGHLDHSKSAKEILRAGIDLYTSQGTADALKLAGHRLHIIKAKEQFKISTWTALAFNMVHEVETLGFLLANGDEKILYATDTCYLKYKFKGLTYILIECNYSQDLLNQHRQSGDVQVELKNYIRRNHMSLETLKGFLRANDLSKVKQIYLLHLSDRHSDAVRFKTTIEGITGKEVYIAQKRKGNNVC